MRGGRAGSLAASPTLVGAVTVLVVVVAVFLAYQANQGLPFVPTYKLSAQVPNANTLVPGNEVRIGGIRVGSVKTVEPVQDEQTGEVAAKVDMELNQDVEPLPEDSTVVVRSRSPLGLKYLELQRGDSEQGFEPGATMPLSAATPEPVEIDQVFNTFDDPTRAAIQVSLTEFGNALAGRGQALNAAIGDLRPLVERLQPVMRNLASPQTGLEGFVRGLAAAAAEAAPVAQVQGDLFVSLETTFAAFAAVSRPYIQDFIEKAPSTEDVTIRTMPRIRPLLVNLTGLFRDLRPGFAAIRPPVSRTIADGTAIGVKALRQSPAFNRQLVPTVQSLVGLANDPVSREGIRDLTSFNNVLLPGLSFITPAQSVCNYGTLAFRNLSSALFANDGFGNYQRFIVLNPPEGPNSEIGPSSAPASGGGEPANFLHYNPYPNTASPGQIRECEAGNEIYVAGQTVIGNTPGNSGIRTSGQSCTQLGNCKKKKSKKKKKKS